jgi:hypothetical protein
MGQLSVESDYFITFQKTSPCHAWWDSVVSLG